MDFLQKVKKKQLANPSACLARMMLRTACGANCSDGAPNDQEQTYQRLTGYNCKVHGDVSICEVLAVDIDPNTGERTKIHSIAGCGQHVTPIYEDATF